MSDHSEFVTVFRSADPSAKQDAERARDRLNAVSIRSIVLDDQTPGVVEGSWEVRVPPADAARAEAIVDAAEPEKATETTEDELEVDSEAQSRDLDFVTLFQSQSLNAEGEAIAVQSLLNAVEIPSQLIGSAQFPSLPFEVRVPKARLEEARTVLSEALQSGAAAVEGDIE